MDNGQFWSSIVAGLISGLISSGLFFYFISTLRPNLSLSKTICKFKNLDGRDVYGIKILNNSKFHVLDLQIEAILMSPFNAPGGTNYYMQWVKLKREHITLFRRYDKKDVSANYAFVVATIDNLDEIWTNETQHFVVKIHGKHSFSGMSRSFEQKYYTKKNCIKDGLFNFGKTFDIS